MHGAPARCPPLARTLASTVVSLALASCLPRTPTGILQQAPACPRDASSASGSCACARDRVVLLGACVEPAVRDAFCGPAAVAGTQTTCDFRTCAPSEALDEGGKCIPMGSV